MLTRILTLSVFALLTTLSACETKVEQNAHPVVIALETTATGKVPDFRYTTAGIIAPAVPASNKLPVDIYLDVTMSMKGFSRPQNTSFSSLLEGIEATVQNAAKSSDLRFFKYGRTVVPIARDTFVAARHRPLWEDKSFESKTDFAQAVDSTDPKRVSIFITDLFYSNSDANQVVNAIQDNCFKKGVEMGIMGLKSDYNGYVGDVQPAVKVVGNRPLYLLVFGSKANISMIFDAFRNQPYMEAGQALLLTHHPVQNFRLEALKAKDSKAINLSSARNQFQNQGNVFAFNWNPDKGSQATVDYTLHYDAEPYTLPITASNLKAHIFRKEGIGKGPAARDSVADAQTLTLQPGAVGAGKIAGKATVGLQMPEDGYAAYQVTWQYDNLGKIDLPNWIMANSTANFSQASPDADKLKTLALDNLVRNLAVSSATQFEPKYGRMYLVFIRK